MSQEGLTQVVRFATARAILPIAAFVLMGLNCDQTMINTVELSPLKLATVTKGGENNNTDEPQCPAVLPVGIVEGLAEGSAKVGYKRDYDPGTQPFNCWWWWADVHRGLIQFDVASLNAPADRITGATLEFDLTTKYVDPAFANNCPNDILSSIWIVNESWSNKFNLAADFMIDNTSKPSCIPNHHSVEVSQVVRDWISGARPNYGFLFIGSDEGTPANDEIEYATTPTNVKLKVLVAVPVTP